MFYSLVSGEKAGPGGPGGVFVLLEKMLGWAKCGVAYSFPEE